MKINASIGVEGFYEAQVFDENKNLKSMYSGRNLITDFGIESIASADSDVTALKRLAVGTGTTEPKNSDNFLENFNQDTLFGFPVRVKYDDEKTITLSRKFEFEFGSVLGDISEVGLASVPETIPDQQNKNPKMFTRTLLKDTDTGTNTVISVGQKDQLVMTYYLVFNLTGSTDSFDLTYVQKESDHTTTVTPSFGVDPSLTAFSGDAPKIVDYQDYIAEETSDLNERGAKNSTTGDLKIVYVFEPQEEGGDQTRAEKPLTLQSYDGDTTTATHFNKLGFKEESGNLEKISVSFVDGYGGFDPVAAPAWSFSFSPSVSKSYRERIETTVNIQITRV